MTRSKYIRPGTLLNYRRLCRLSIRPIVPGLYHQLYLNKCVNSSLAWDGLQVTLMELGRAIMAIFMIFYLKMSILKNGANTNMIRIPSMNAYPSATLDIGL